MVRLFFLFFLLTLPPDGLMALQKTHTRSTELSRTFENTQPIVDRDQSKRPSLGEKNAKQTVLLFIDPYCEYCREAYSVYANYVKTNKNLKVIIHYYPIHGTASVTASQALLSAHTINQHASYQKALSKAIQKNQEKPLTKKALLKIAQNLNFQENQMKLFKERAFEASQSKEQQNLLTSTIKIAQQFKLDVTPAFFIQTPSGSYQLEIGFVKPEELEEILSQLQPNKTQSIAHQKTEGAPAA